MSTCRLEIIDTLSQHSLLVRLSRPLKEKTVYTLIKLARSFDQQAFTTFRRTPSFINLFYCCCPAFGRPITLQVRFSRGLYHLTVLDFYTAERLDTQSDKYPYIALRKIVYRWLKRAQ